MPRAAHVGVRERRARVPGVGERARAPLLHEPVPLQLHLAHRIAELVPLAASCRARCSSARYWSRSSWSRYSSSSSADVEQIEVAVGGAAHAGRGGRSSRCAGRGSPGAGSTPRSAAGSSLPSADSKRSSSARELGLALEARLLHDDREPEVHGQHEHAAAAGRTRRRSRRARSSRRCAGRPRRPRCSAAG